MNRAFGSEQWLIDRLIAAFSEAWAALEKIECAGRPETAGAPDCDAYYDLVIDRTDPLLNRLLSKISSETKGNPELQNIVNIRSTDQFTADLALKAAAQVLGRHGIRAIVKARFRGDY